MSHDPATFTVGQTHDHLLVEDLKRTTIVQYGGASGDFNPLHTDEVAARAAGHPTVLAHGMMTMGMTGRCLTEFLGEHRLHSFGGRFRSAVYPGDTLTGTTVVTRIDGTTIELALTTTNQRGDVVFNGLALATHNPKVAGSNSAPATN